MPDSIRNAICGRLVQIAHQLRDFLNVKKVTVICLSNEMMAICQQDGAGTMITQSNASTFAARKSSAQLPRDVSYRTRIGPGSQEGR
jgi:hypothetical protein